MVRSMNRKSSKQKRSVLLVHGHHFKPAAETLADLSFRAIGAGLKRDYPDCLAAFEHTTCKLAYYGDLSNAVLSDAGKRYDEKLDTSDREKALKLLSEITARKRFGIRQYDRLPGKSALGEFIADVTMPIFARTGLTVPVVSLVARDFARYLRAQDDYARRVRERVRAAIVDSLQRGDRLMLITHGTGAAVAWDVLWELSHDDDAEAGIEQQKVDLWVTLGAPLGDSGIRRHLRGSKARGEQRFPVNVLSWVNVSAEDDYTCHDQTLADDFRKMVRERFVGSVEDYKIYNHAVRYGRSNPHSSIGYYIHPRLSKIIADWLPEPGLVEAETVSAEDAD